MARIEYVTWDVYQAMHNPHKPGCGRMAYSWRFGKAEPCLCGAEPQYAPTVEQEEMMDETTEINAARRVLELLDTAPGFMFRALLKEHGQGSGDYQPTCKSCQWVDEMEATRALLVVPPPADNDHVAPGASLFPEGTLP